MYLFEKYNHNESSETQFILFVGNQCLVFN